MDLGKFPSLYTITYIILHNTNKLSKIPNSLNNMSILKIQDCKLCFIGGGNMGAAIVAGLLAKGSSTPRNIVISDPSDTIRAKAQTKFGVRTTKSNLDAARDAHVLVLSVKPQVARAVCLDLASLWNQQLQDRPWPLVVSIVGGIPLGSLMAWLALEDGRAPKVVRVMPNTPALLGEGASGAFAGADVSADEKSLVASLLSGFSKVTEWVGSEEMIDVVTGVSGMALRLTLALTPGLQPALRFLSSSLALLFCCFSQNSTYAHILIPRGIVAGSGPAYFFALVEHMAASATALGLPSEQAERLAKQTCLGAGRMLLEAAGDSPAQLRKNVTSLNGTTEAALKSFDAFGFQQIVDNAVRAAVARAEELGRALG